MSEIQDLNVTDASNTGRWPENMQFSAVNDAGRADEGLLARWYKDMDASVTASGSSNAFTATSNRTISSLVNNTVITWTANHTISGASTLNLNGLGAKNIKRFNGDALASGDITSGQPVTTIYKSSPDQWYMMTAAASLATAGTFFDFTENAAPGTPAASVGRLYAFDGAAHSVNTAMGFADPDGNVRTLLLLATQAQMEAATATLFGPSAATQKHHPAHPKAWASADSVGGLNASFGVTSITRNSAGNYTANLSTAMSSASYCVVGAALHSVANDTKCFMLISQTASTFTYSLTDATGGVAQDLAHHFIVMGDQ